METGQGSALYGAGTEERHWVRGPRIVCDGAEEYPITQRDVRIPTRDGTALAAAVIEPVLPADADRPPAIVVTNGYAEVDALFLPHLRRLAELGYVVVFARLRGVPPSEGLAGFYERFGPDGHDVIEWAAAQPFTNGRVGMVGASLLGISQWLAAKEHPEHLVVVVPDDAPSDTYRHLWYVGGTEPGPGRRQRREVAGVQSEYTLAMENPWFNDFWRERSVTREDLEELARRGLPALMSTGWDSHLVDCASRPFTWMRGAGAGGRVKLVIGPWRHASMFCPDSFGSDPAPGESLLPYSGFDLEVRWLDRWLRGTDNGVDTEPPVLIHVQGPDQWRYEADWPLPDERRVRLHMGAGPTGTVGSLNDGILSRSPRPDETVSGYRFDPAVSANPVALSMPSVTVTGVGAPGGEELPPGVARPYGRLVMDKSRYEAQALTWTSGVLRRAGEITGYVAVELWAEVSGPEATFVVELMDVAPPAAGAGAGAWSSVQITRGYLRADAQFSRTGPTELVPADVYRFEIELQPTSYVVAAGHRLRVTVQGTPIDPAMDLQWQGPGANSEPFSFTIHTGPSAASRVDIPFIGDQPEFLAP